MPVNSLRKRALKFLQKKVKKWASCAFANDGLDSNDSIFDSDKLESVANEESHFDCKDLFDNFFHYVMDTITKEAFSRKNLMLRKLCRLSDAYALFEKDLQSNDNENGIALWMSKEEFF